LITGGTGGIGFRLAEHLAARVPSHFILTGYSAFPAENEWDHWLQTHEESDKVSYKIRKIREYAQLGSTIKIYSADAADEQRMKEVITDAESRLGYINGVIHAAGLADYAGIIQKRSLETTEKILAPKVKGTMILEEIFKDRELDFLILFSSLASILPSFGQVAYTAANQFLDAYAQAKFVSSRAAQKKGLTISINWDAWQEVGMAVQAVKKTGNTPEQALRSAISSSEGVEAFSRILSYGLPQVVVSTLDLELIIRYGKTAQKEEEDITVAAPQDAVPRPEISAAYIAPRDETEQMVARIWEHFFGIEKIGCNDDFSELGGDSLKAVTLVARVQKAMNVQIPLADFFKNPTVAGLAAYIGKASPGQFKAIEAVETREYYGLSSAQKRLYILQQMDPLSVSYNVTQLWRLEGQLDSQSLESAFRKSIDRHESLRTSFAIINEEPVQRIHDEVAFNIEILGVREPASGISDFIRPFELSRAPLLRVGLIRETETRYILLVDIHHIVTDGVSLGLLLQEFKVFYTGEELPALRLQYKDYARWQSSPSQRKEMQRQETYWLEQFSGEIPVLEFPLDFPRPVRQSFAGASSNFEIPAAELRELKELTAKEGGTLYMVLLSLTAIFFAKLANHDDIIIGTPMAGRRHADLENMIGMFVNTLTLRNFPVGEKKFIDFLAEVKERTLAAFENQDFQFEDLVERVLVSRDIARNPLFDVVFMLLNVEAQPGNIPDINIPGLMVKPYENPFPAAKFDITLSCFESNDGLHFSLEYCTKLFKKETIDRFINYYKNIVSAVLKQPNRKIIDIELLTEMEKQQLLVEFNNTKAPYPNDKTIHDLFAEQASKTPDSISVLPVQQVQPVRPVQLTYRQLNEQANRLAGMLSKKGVMSDSIVAIIPERTIEMIIGILGILKSGGAYLPIDPEYPQERIDYMLKDSGAKLLLTANEIASDVFNSHHSSSIVHHSGQLAYIIYTSGSTGKPKGVMVEHRNVVRLVKNTHFVEFRENERLLQTGALEFDASTFEIWGSLLNGMSLCISAKDEILNPGKLKENIIKYNISTMWLTSPLFNQLSGMELEIFKGLKNLLVGGDVLSPLHINRVRERFPHLNIINGYGPTENTTFSTTFKIDKEYSQRIPIGKPIAHSTAYVVDKAGHSVPVGVSGELLAGGDGVSRGYLNNPELTAEKFINFHHSKLYRTGDLARWMADGNIEFIGRIDQQVKIRGFRIELEEIESELSKHDRVKEVVVIDRKEEN
ncbi:MAG TPA: amino acid adenylation domain-containing protein, partial [Candidatus Deferrimicrobium sp.]|nr:amino acid adenylation domain-containing protein [Candidatus Deferrimicrobium sp.]